MDLMEYNRNIYNLQKDNITTEDKVFLKWCPALKNGIMDLVKRKEDYANYLNNVKINKYIIEPMRENSDAINVKYLGVIDQAVGLSFFVYILIEKYIVRYCKST